MFGTSHPQAPHRKEVAMQIVQGRRQEFEGKELVIDMPEPGRIGPALADAVRFEVRYNLREYLGMVSGHVRFLLRHEDAARRRRTIVPLAIALPALLGALALDAGWARMSMLAIACLALGSLPATVRFWVALLATPVFYLKKRRMPVCDFRIDAEGIERTTPGGRRFWAWSDVRSVRLYRPGYLLMCADGGLPIPLRCMNVQEQERLRRWAYVT